ncbi:reverse transcriptase domain-containing protein [Tanacetum coccineum]|uniref:Reverse transcriptase domain-containing protein n=1 Tax=Tanacetum coccineum TaxID=301880 RepID=A0ABQ5GDX5_9ASTR
MDKVHRDKRKEVHTRLDFGDNTKRNRRTRESSQNSSVGTWSARHQNPSEKPRMKDRSRDGDENVFGRLGRPHRRDSPSSRGRSRSKDRSRGIEESYDNTYSSYRTESRHGHRSRDRGRSRIMKRGRTSESPLSRVSESGTSDGGHWKSASKRQKLIDEEDLVVTWTWTARVWFDELPPKSIDGYKDLKAAFLAYFMQQKKYVKDPVEIHNIKQRDGESLEDFIECFKVETGRMKGAPECMRISRFMHGVNNPELTKRLNEHVPKTMEEMMTVTTAFIQGETVAASKKKGHAPWKPQDQSKRHVSERKSDF